MRFWTASCFAHFSCGSVSSCPEPPWSCPSAGHPRRERMLQSAPAWACAARLHSVSVRCAEMLCAAVQRLADGATRGSSCVPQGALGGRARAWTGWGTPSESDALASSAPRRVSLQVLELDAGTLRICMDGSPLIREPEGVCGPSFT